MICELLGKGKLPTLSEALGALENGFVQAGSSGGARELLLKSGGNSCKFPMLEINHRIGFSEVS